MNKVLLVLRVESVDQQKLVAFNFVGSAWEWWQPANIEVEQETITWNNLREGLIGYLC